MAQGLDELDAMIARIQALPELIPRAVPALATEIKAELDRTIKAGTDPYGQAWEPRKADGEQPLQNAAAAVSVTGFQNTIHIRVYGPEAMHHLGRAKGRVTRVVIPTDKIPAAMADRMVKVLTDLFKVATS